MCFAISNAFYRSSLNYCISRLFCIIVTAKPRGKRLTHVDFPLSIGRGNAQHPVEKIVGEFLGLLLPVHQIREHR